MNNHPPEELKEQLLEFQAALIHNADRRRKTQISFHNPRHAKMLNEIWEAAKVADIPVSGAKKWRKLGFSVTHCSSHSSLLRYFEIKNNQLIVSLLVRSAAPRVR